MSSSSSWIVKLPKTHRRSSLLISWSAFDTRARSWRDVTQCDIEDLFMKCAERCGVDLHANNDTLPSLVLCIPSIEDLRAELYMPRELYDTLCRASFGKKTRLVDQHNDDDNQNICVNVDALRRWQYEHNDEVRFVWNRRHLYLGLRPLVTQSESMFITPQLLYKWLLSLAHRAFPTVAHPLLCVAVSGDTSSHTTAANVFGYFDFRRCVQTFDMLCNF